jgi:hypothetical protein
LLEASGASPYLDPVESIGRHCIIRSRYNCLCASFTSSMV